MKTLKTILIILISGFLFSGLNPLISYSQNAKTRANTETKTRPPNVKIKASEQVSKEEVLKKISKNTKSFKKDLRGNWLLEEDFESGNFPPSGWSIDFGATEWGQEYVSAYGNGNYCMFYSFWQWNFSNNSIYTSSFSPTQTGDNLIFDYAYAPYDDNGPVYYDDLEIYYFDENDLNWHTLIYYFGSDLQTAPATSDFFVPQSNEWGTKTVAIPNGAVQIYFRAWENSGNNLFIDNIKVGTPAGGTDASVEFVWSKGRFPLGYGVPETIPVLIKNVGASTIFNLDVTLNISGANNLSDVIQIPVLNPGDTMQVDFLGFTPILTGFSDVTVSIPFDDNLNNNEVVRFTEVTTNTMRYVDSNCCNASVGWIGEFSFVNKYYMSGTGQIRNANIKLSGDGNVGQIVYAYVVGNDGTVLGKSPHYKIQSGDQDKYKTFYITDPKPPIVTDNYYYIGIAQTEYAGDGFVFTPQQFLYETPARPQANYGAALGPVGSVVGTFDFPREYGQNYAIEAVLGDQLLIDNGISDPGLIYDQYFTTTVHTPVVKVFNAGTALTSFNIKRTISPGGYTSTKTVTGLVSGGNANVTFDPWTFTSGTTYTIKDSILTFDGNISNNHMTSTITPRIAKQLCVLWSQQDDRDSLVRAINSDGRYSNNFDTVRMNYTGSFRPWKIVFANFGNEKNYSPWIRDSLKKFIDTSTAANKRTLVVFGNQIAFSNDPDIYFPSPADSIFYRQYLKAKTISDNWPVNIPNSQNRFRGIGFFNGITQDSLSDPATPELIQPTNGGSAAFKPQSVTGNGTDSCNAVSFAGANYNTFFMTNKFSSLRASGSSPSSPMGPVKVYIKIIDWIQSVNTGVKVLDLTVKIEGFYDPSINYNNQDTMRVYLRSLVSPYPKVDSAKSYLDAAGNASFIFNNASNGTQYYIQLKHRNGLETWSKTTQSFSSNHLAYNFTTAANKAFGDNMILKGAKWVIYTGDVDQNGYIDLTDMNLVFNDAAAFNSGYLKTDVNGDNIIDLTDLVSTFNNSSNFIQTKSPLAPDDFIKLNEMDSYNNLQTVSEMENSYQSENKIDHEIYERFKNESPGKSAIPDLNVIQGGSIKRITGNKK